MTRSLTEREDCDDEIWRCGALDDTLVALGVPTGLGVPEGLEPKDQVPNPEQAQRDIDVLLLLPHGDSAHDEDEGSARCSEPIGN